MNLIVDNLPLTPSYLVIHPEAEFKEFEPRLKYGWLHFKSYSMFQDLSWRSIKPFFGGFETRLRFIKFGLSFLYIVI